LRFIFARIKKDSIVRIKSFGVTYVNDCFKILATISDDYLGLIRSD